MTAEKKHESAGFAIGVILLFTFMMSIELIIPNAKPKLALPVYILFSITRAVLANIFILIITRWINVKLDHKIPWYPNALKRLLTQGFITVIMSAIIISTMVSTLIAFVVPYADKVVATERALIFSNIFALVLSIFYTGVYFFNQWGRTRLEAEQLKSESIQSQFIALKNQVSPHFLFNSLNTLSSLISEDQIRATDFVQNLAKVYRYVVQSIEKKVVDLDTELKVAEAYVYLQQTRFGKCLNVSIEIPEDYKHYTIAPFTLQILLENAIKHNIISNDRPLYVQILVESDKKLVVKNNLQRKSSVEYGTGVGLKNVVKRYELLSDEVVDIREINSEFIITIPLLESSIL